MPFDLFGEVPVTDDELLAWVAAVAPRWLSPERAFRHYCATWDVAGKIRRAKVDGTFWSIIEERRPAWHPHLALDVILQA